MSADSVAHCKTVACYDKLSTSSDTAIKCAYWLMTACRRRWKRPVIRWSDEIDTIRCRSRAQMDGGHYKLIYRRHISRLLSPEGRRAGVTEAFNLSLSADSYTTPALPSPAAAARPVSGPSWPQSVRRWPVSAGSSVRRQR